MISAFIKEQKRYSKTDLVSLFESDSDKIVGIIKKLKEYGILKAVKASKNQKDMSDLVEEDIEIEDTETSDKNYYYVFTFVGVITVFGVVLKCYPKYIHSNEKPLRELSQILKVTEKYNAKEQIIKMVNISDDSKSFNLLAVMLYLLKDYFEYGVYENTMDIIETNGEGEILWDKTINETFTFISKNRPYYMELYTQKNINDELDYFKRLHESIISICSTELQESGLDELFGIPVANISDEELDDFGNTEDILYRIQMELNQQFITRKQLLLKTMYAYVAQNSHLSDETILTMFGSNSFNLVWEKVCAEVMDNRLSDRVMDLPVNVPKINQSAKIIELIEKPHWHGDDDNFVQDSKKTLKPDIVAINRDGDNYQFIILDAKYYNLTLEKEKIFGYPGVGDVTKQYLYQLAYKNFIDKVGFSAVKNCFLMPTEDEEIISVGHVNMKMLDELGLESIQIRKIPAAEIYDDYLRNKKFKIERLNI
ncbi:LlaJI family restriction endonuclease [Leuconostoc mesenteroides]|uniref:LlaJI family restriction endonuclease n=1 Tax=Leuconostoc mesenteroides TaxID=1245 RepID=UPI002360A37F|nr:LlaJI family restriction endonuclease [Leuconostoc mesenteroides]